MVHLKPVTIVNKNIHFGACSSTNIYDKNIVYAVR